MFSFFELALIGGIALIVIGPERLPGAARTAGLWVGKFRRMVRDAKIEIDRELREQDVVDLDDLKQDIHNAGKELAEVGKNIGESVTGSPSQQSTASGAAKKTTRKKSIAGSKTVNKAKKKTAKKVTQKIGEIDRKKNTNKTNAIAN